MDASCSTATAMPPSTIPLPKSFNCFPFLGLKAASEVAALVASRMANESARTSVGSICGQYR